MSIRTEESMRLVEILREDCGRDAVGVGPDTSRLVELWQQDFKALRSAIDQLCEIGFLKVERVIGSSSGRPDELRDIAGVQMTEGFQQYCDRNGI